MASNLMIYDDIVYGKMVIQDPVLLDLMESAALQRLRGVFQHGVTGLLGITDSTTRFDHSVGTMLLVAKLGGSLEEQIAALMHDISHTAFSHVIDYVYYQHKQQHYHETVKASYIANSELPSILSGHGYDWHKFVDEKPFTLLERPSPSLCADRIDYFLRDALGLGITTQEETGWALGNLVVKLDLIAVKNVETARWFGYRYMKADEARWANFREVALYELTARTIRAALALGVITEADFWGTDRQLWRKLLKSEAPGIREQLDYVSSETQFVWDEANYDFQVSTKIRTIDPEVLIEGELCPLSSVDNRFASERNAYVERNQGKWPIRIIRS